MASSLWIREFKCKDDHCFLEYESLKDKCLSCDNKYSNKLDEELKNKFKNIFKVSNSYINEFILLLRKSVYPYG